MGSPTASIVVRCYNEREHIGRLLHGIYEQRRDDFEVILVDSGSTDGTLEVARQFPIDEVVYVAPEEFSFGLALNRGCEVASGDYCVFASAHVYPVRRDWLDRLLEKFDDPGAGDAPGAGAAGDGEEDGGGNGEIALVYGKQRGNEVTKFPERRVFERWFPDHDRDRQASPFCNNANAAIRRDLWERFPYDEDLTGLEDVDWAKRVREAGYEISYASEATIVHVHDETTREVFDRYRREAIAHKQIVPEQSFSLGDLASAVVRNVGADAWAALRRGEPVESFLEIPRFRIAQFWGTYRGFNDRTPVSERLRQRFFYPDTEAYPDRDQFRDDSEDDLRIDYAGAIGPDGPDGATGDADPVDPTDAPDESTEAASDD